jgi:hypothetical protein
MARIGSGWLKVAVVAAMGFLAPGCGKNACQQYDDDLIAKYQSCGISVMTSTSTSSSTSTTCTDALAKQANCLDACLPKVDCPCTKDPTGSACAQNQRPYSNCVVACATAQ